MKIAVCIPVYGDTKAKFTLSLLQMFAFTAKAMPDVDLVPLMVQSTPIIEARRILLEAALKCKATHILWADADHVFPPDALKRLLAHRLPVVGCSQPRRTPPHLPSAAVFVSGKRRPLWTTAEKAAAGVVEPVASLGLGFCLVETAALAAIEPPFFAGVNEDTHFHDKLLAAGVHPHVDHRLSAEMGHIAETVLSLEWALQQHIDQGSAAAEELNRGLRGK
ncbi:MAG: hypothetical protein E6G92_04190 [Alphaproteobacteria bacterium]|nr:MAG: hypothetical protein E6G92_04190 [Alphaproteobacteria bacterium]